MAKQYWLFKSEPKCFSIEHLEASPGGVASWDGVRNYQARNMLRDKVKVGDEVLFYYSNAQPPGIAGIALVVKSGYHDPTALNPKSQYYDPKATLENPRWYMVDIRFVLKLSKIIPLAILKKTPQLENMMVTQKTSRLSIQPVTPREWRVIKKLMGEYK